MTERIFLETEVVTQLLDIDDGLHRERQLYPVLVGAPAVLLELEDEIRGLQAQRLVVGDHGEESERRPRIHQIGHAHHQRDLRRGNLGPPGVVQELRVLDELIVVEQPEHIDLVAGQQGVQRRAQALDVDLLAHLRADQLDLFPGGQGLLPLDEGAESRPIDHAHPSDRRLDHRAQVDERGHARHLVSDAGGVLQVALHLLEEQSHDHDCGRQLLVAVGLLVLAVQGDRRIVHQDQAGGRGPGDGLRQNRPVRCSP